ncbi:response regulator [Paenibacillus sp. SGZ-1009]|uniref:response regulator n=1 Tax=Paenibacillus campi TaxID=3106031 RepID=UPI002AFF5BF4|nr:response regulator [Paenibacillus sp. SGZ-1009]
MINVLIVEDDPMVAEMNKFYLGQVAGFRCRGWASSTIQALEWLQQPEHSIDLVLLDIYMKEQSGLDLLADIRRARIEVDVIIISAASDKTSIRYALQNGAVDYLIKPFEFDRLRAALSAYRERHSLLHDHTSLAQSELDLLTQPSHSMEKTALGKGLTRVTMRLIWEAIGMHKSPGFSSEEIAGQTGLSRVSVGKYLTAMEELGVLELETTYGTIGRPVKRYHIVSGAEAMISKYI